MNANLSENEIDKLVIAQAQDDDAWHTPITVNKNRGFSLRFPPAFEIECDKDVLSGTPVFRGTRVPVSALIDNLENGVSVDEFIHNFPTVKREQAVKILELFKNIFMLSHRFCFQLALVVFQFKLDQPVVYLDKMLEIVNVDKLNVKLIVEMFYFLELVFGEGGICGILKFDIVLCEFVSILAKCLSP